VNKSDLIDELAGHVGGRATATRAVEMFIETVTRTVSKGEKVAISGFGVFEKADRAARTGRNPSTGQPVKIKKTSVPKFRPGTDFKAYVSGAKKLAKATPSRVVARSGVRAAVGTVRATASKAAGTRSATKAPSKAGARSTVKVTPARRATATKTATKTAKAAAAKTTSKATGRTAAKATTRSAAKSSTRVPAKKASKTTAKAPAKRSSR